MMMIAELSRDQLSEFAGLLVTLLIFFSIDAKFRFRRRDSSQKALFRISSIVGGLAAVTALAVVWVELFLPEDNEMIHVLVYFVPASLAIVAAFVLSVEVIFMRKSGREGSDGGRESREPELGPRQVAS
ncbi:hypothetical protein ACF07D_11910 [Leucobacter sp. NPDC015123]|uniref:hypothetical protein n=1 Tax=Leucobacter sp. NPDC015123 TaxID=3364129 RepID=UPI0036F45B34